MIMLLYFAIKMDGQVPISFFLSTNFSLLLPFQWSLCWFCHPNCALLLCNSRVGYWRKREKNEEPSLWQIVTFRFLFFVLFFPSFGLTKLWMRHRLHYIVHLKHSRIPNTKQSCCEVCQQKRLPKYTHFGIWTLRLLHIMCFIVCFFSFISIEWCPDSRRMNWLPYTIDEHIRRRKI